MLDRAAAYGRLAAQLGGPAISCAPSHCSAEPQSTAEQPIRPYRIQPATGNVALAISLPRGSVADPPLVFFYNSGCPGRSSYGFGWGSLYGQRIEKVLMGDGGDVVRIHKGSGAVRQYARPPESTVFQAPSGVASSLQKSGSDWVETQPNGFKLIYADSGSTAFSELSALEDRQGNRWTISRVGLQVQSITNPAALGGGVTNFSYDGQGNLQGVTDSSGRETRFTVTLNPLMEGDLTQITFPDGVCNLGYDLGHRLTNWINPAGEETRFSYWPDNRIHTATRGGAAVTTYAYTNGATVVTDALSRITTYTRVEGSYAIAEAVDPLGGVSVWTWNGDALRSYTNPQGQETRFEYQNILNGTQRLASVTDPEGGKFTFVYDDVAGRVEAVIDPKSRAGTLVWAAIGAGEERTGVVDPKGFRTSYVYAGAAVQAAMDPLGQRTTWSYDAVGRRDAAVNPLGERTTYAYNAHSWRQSIENPLGLTTTFVRDAMNRTRAVVNPLGQRSTFAYDGVGRMVEQINALGYRVVSAYDNYGRLASVTNALDETTEFAYDLVDNLVATTDPLNHTTTQIYDPNNPDDRGGEPARRADYVWLRRRGAADLHPGSAGASVDRDL